jgi:RNA polymerase sigma factor (sigma-70 family)
MHDRDMVAAIVAGDPAGLAAAYDSYAAALHAFCRSLLAEPADAADAVQDTFLIAAAKLGGLRDPDRLRPWLYAVARNECHRRLRARSAMASLDEAGEMTDTSADVAAGASRGELQDLVRAAIAGLNPGDREVIELHLRHDLDGADLAGALGVPLNQAHALASRARGQLERSIGALLVARTGREYCTELAAMLAGWDGQLTVLLRKRVNRHIERCEVCGERKRRELSPAALLSVLPLVALPPGLRQQVLRLVSDVTPDAARYRDRVASRAEPFSASGFPVPVHPAFRGRLRGRAVVYAAAAAIVIIAAGGGTAAAMLRHGGGPPGATAHPAATVTAAPGAPSPSPQLAAGSLSPTAAPASSPASPAPAVASSPASVPSPTPSPAASRSPSPSPSRSPTPSPSPSAAPGTLSVSTTIVRLPQPNSSATFTLTAQGGPVTFTITVPVTPGTAPGLSVSPLSGTLPAGHSVTVTVTAINNGPPVYQTVLTLSPGGATVTVDYAPRG